MQLAHRGHLARKVLLGQVARLVQQVGLDRVVPLALLAVRVRLGLQGQQEERGHRDLVGLAEQRDLLGPQALVAQQVGQVLLDLLDQQEGLDQVAHQVLLVLGQVALLGQAAPQVLSILGKVRG